MQGPLDDVARYGYTARTCGLGTEGRAEHPLEEGSWFFLVVCGDEEGCEGSYGTGAGGERLPMASDAACPWEQDLTGRCD